MKVPAQRELYADYLRGDQASIMAQTLGKPDLYKIFVLDLSTAQSSGSPYKISVPFKHFFVIDSVGVSPTFNLRIGGSDTYYDSIPIYEGYSFTLQEPAREAYLDWSAQTGKSMTILLMMRGEFKSNTMFMDAISGVSLYYGSSIETQTGVQVTGTAAQIFAADGARRKMDIFNHSSVAIYLGDSAVTGSAGTKPGVKVLPGGYYEWLSDAACYAITDGLSTGANEVGLLKFYG